MAGSSHESPATTAHHHSEFVHIFRNVSSYRPGEIVILTSANNLKTFRFLLDEALEEAGKLDQGADFTSEVARARRRIEANSWLVQGVNTCVIDSRWNWSDYQFQVCGSATISKPLPMTERERQIMVEEFREGAPWIDEN